MQLMSDVWRTDESIFVLGRGMCRQPLPGNEI
jgi:hypothetical protein